MSQSHTTAPRLTASPNSTRIAPANDNAATTANDNAAAPLTWHLSVTEIPRLGLWEAVALEVNSGMRFAWLRADRDAAIAGCKADVDAYELMVGGAL